MSFNVSIEQSPLQYFLVVRREHAPIDVLLSTEAREREAQAFLPLFFDDEKSSSHRSYSGVGWLALSFSLWVCESTFFPVTFDHRVQWTRHQFQFGELCARTRHN